MLKKEKKAKEKKQKPIKSKPAKQAGEVKISKPPPNRRMGKYIFLRWVLYIAVLGILAIGIWLILQGDRTQGIRSELEAATASMQTNVKVYTEAQAFAQSFVKEYLTYENRQIDDYRRRIQQYCSPRLSSEIIENVILKNDASVAYVQALDTVQYGKNQYDVSVMAEVVYTKPETVPNGAPVVQNDGTTTPGAATDFTYSISEKKRIYLIVPVFCDGNGGYTIEDIPVFTAPNIAAEYARTEYTGTYADDSDKAAAQQMLTDFFKTFYSEPQNKIEYYLSGDADRKKFTALELADNVRFEKIESMSLYKSNNAYIAVVTIKTLDYNGSELKQRYNMQLIKTDKFYAKDINARTYNLNL